MSRLIILNSRVENSYFCKLFIRRHLTVVAWLWHLFDEANELSNPVYTNLVRRQIQSNGEAVLRLPRKHYKCPKMSGLQVYAGGELFHLAISDSPHCRYLDAEMHSISTTSSYLIRIVWIYFSIPVLHSQG